MTVKDMFYELVRAGGKVLIGIGSAAVEVLRQGDYQEDEDQSSSLSLVEFYRNSPRGDGEYPVDPNGVHDSSH